jgi:Ca-activated chloride channel family protein
MKKRFLIQMVLCALVCFTSFLNAQPLHEDKTLSPYFSIENENSTVEKFPLKSTNVDVLISGVIADVTVKQEYKNEGSTPINAHYIFPASTRAAVHGMHMKIGDEIIIAKIKEREIAQQEFNIAKEEGKSASLLQQQRPNVFSMDIANILPGDQIIVELRYTEHLVPTDGIYEFVYPTVVLPRYSNQVQSQASSHDSWVKNPYLKKGTDPGTSFTIKTGISSPLPLQDLTCQSHKTNTEWHDTNSALLTLSDPNDFGGNRDYIVQYRLTDKQIASGLMLYEGNNEKFFLLMAQPPEKVTIANIPAREYIFVVDVSSSMHGFPLETSKTLLKDLIGKLRPDELFNVILFAGGSRLLSEKSLTATSNNIDKAIRLIEDQDGGGGTELLPAMEKALKLPLNDSYSRSIVVVTDGGISEEKEVFELLQNNIDKTNVFAFGIGSSVNRYLIEGLANAGQGEPFIVTDPDKAQNEANRLRSYIASPVLTNIKIDYNGFDVYDIETKKVPDMLAGRPIIVFGKYRGSPKGSITVSGHSGTGDYKYTCNVQKCTPQESNVPLRYLWARKRISRLSDFNVAIDNEQKTEITNLGLTYNLLTDYTSFLAVHDVIRNGSEKAQDVTQPLSLPLHVSNLAVGGAMHQTPEPEFYFLLIAAIFVSLLSLFRIKKV